MSAEICTYEIVQEGRSSYRIYKRRAGVETWLGVFASSREASEFLRRHRYYNEQPADGTR